MLCLLGHVDTVLADPGEWSVDPWSGELRDDCVWGRGAIDMKSQVASELAAALALAGEGWRPEAGELKLVFTSDEEAGALHGAQWLCSEHPDKVRADMVVNEGAGVVIPYDGRRVYGVCVAEKGVFRFNLVAHGRAGHASVPRIGDNALVKLAPALEALAAARPAFAGSPESRRSSARSGWTAATPRAPSACSRPPIPACRARGADARSDAGADMASASTKINVIPAQAELGVDCRVPPELGEEAVRAALGGLLEDGLELEFAEQVVGNRSAIDTPLMESIRSFVGREDPGGSSARSPCRASRTRTGGGGRSPTAWRTASSRRRRWTCSSARPDPRSGRAHPRFRPGACGELLRWVDGGDAAMTAPVPEEKLRLGGMALRNGLLVHGPTHWAAAVRTGDGEVRVASGRKPDLGGKAAQRVPGVRGVVKLAEAMAVIPLVKRALPEARLPMQDMRTLGAMGVAALGAQAIRTAGSRTVGREAAVAAVSMMPALLALRSGELAAYHGVEHKSIAAYEKDGQAADADKEHDRCGSHLVAPMLAAAALGTWPPAAPGCEGRRPRRSSGSGAPPWRSRSSPGESATRIRG